MKQPQFFFDVYTLQGASGDVRKFEGRTAAVSEKQAINNVRCNTRGIFESQYKDRTPWVAIKKGPVSQEDAMQDMINMAEKETKRKANTYIDVNFDYLARALKAEGNKFSDANVWLGHGNSYLSQRRKYGQLSLLDIEELEKRGFPRVLYITQGTEPEGKKEEPAADLPEVSHETAPSQAEPKSDDRGGTTIKVEKVTELLAALIHMTPEEYIEMALREFNDRIIAKIMEVIPE